MTQETCPPGETPGDALTFGIEEEFFVVDRRGRLSQAGDDVVDAAEAAVDDQGELQHELTRSQAEAATDVCQTHAEALRQLRGMRATWERRTCPDESATA